MIQNLVSPRKAPGAAFQQCPSYHVVARLHILSNPMADQRWLRGTVYKRYKLVLVIFWKVFIFNLKKREGFISSQLSKYRKYITTATDYLPIYEAKPFFSSFSQPVEPLWSLISMFFSTHKSLAKLLNASGYLIVIVTGTFILITAAGISNFYSMLFDPLSSSVMWM